uniref:hypothetical protein n=1 Tax=Arcobacter sp. TaxID=1872629 RepID=UPI003D12B022
RFLSGKPDCYSFLKTGLVHFCENGFVEIKKIENLKRKNCKKKLEPLRRIVVKIMSIARLKKSKVKGTIMNNFVEETI